jgi:hypothetical protein
MYKTREEIEAWMKANKIDGHVDEELEIIASSRVIVNASWAGHRPEGRHP